MYPTPTENQSLHTAALATKRNWYHGVEGVNTVRENTRNWIRTEEVSVIRYRSRLWSPNKLWTDCGGLLEKVGAWGACSSTGVGAMGESVVRLETDTVSCSAD